MRPRQLFGPAESLWRPEASIVTPVRQSRRGCRRSDRLIIGHQHPQKCHSILWGRLRRHLRPNGSSRFSLGHGAIVDCNRAVGLLSIAHVSEYVVSREYCVGALEQSLALFPSAPVWGESFDPHLGQVLLDAEERVTARESRAKRQCSGCGRRDP
jgi:hypothetical protein